MGLKAALLVFLVAAIALSNATLTFQFSGNFSASLIIDNGWKFQAASLVRYNVLGGWLGGNFKYATTQGNLLNGSAEIVAGSAYANIGGYPFNFLAYFQANYNLGIDLENKWASASVAASTGYVGNAFLALEEVDPQSNIVKVRSLRWRLKTILNSEGMSYTFANFNTDSSKGPLYVTFVGSSNSDGDSLLVTLTFLSSEVAGIIDNTIAIVPKTIESVVRIQNYPYANPANHLNLVMGVGTGGANVAISGRTVFSTNDSVYFSLSGKATVDGVVSPVNISAFTEGNLLAETGNLEFSAQLTGKYGANADFHLVRVSFPPGTDIYYDPSLGTGKAPAEVPGASVDDVNDSSDSSSASSLSTFLSLVVFLALSLAL